MSPQELKNLLFIYRIPQKEVVTKTGFTAAYVSMVLNGKVKPNPVILDTAMEALRERKGDGKDT